MKSNFRTAIATGVTIFSIVGQAACHAQSAPSSHAGDGVPSLADLARQTAGGREFLASAKNEQPVDPTAAAPAASSAPSATSSSSASTEVPFKNDAVIKELAEMKARIAQLEAELKTHSGDMRPTRSGTPMRCVQLKAR